MTLLPILSSRSDAPMLRWPGGQIQHSWQREEAAFGLLVSPSITLFSFLFLFFFPFNCFARGLSDSWLFDNPSAWPTIIPIHPPSYRHAWEWDDLLKRFS